MIIRSARRIGSRTTHQHLASWPGIVRGDRYVKGTIVDWARRRYTRNGELVITIGRIPTKFSRIERAAFDRYLGPPKPLDATVFALRII